MASLSLLVAGALFASRAQAYQGAVSGATAQSGRAALDNNDTPFMNPAGVAQLNGYYFSSTYSAGALVPELKQKEYSVAMTENLKETLIPTSLGFNERVTTLEERTDIRKRVQLSFGQLLRPALSLGLGINYQDDFFVDHYRQINATVGALWVPTSDLGIALVLEDFVPQSSRLPVAVRQNTKTSVGVAYLYRTLIRMRADLISAENNAFAKPTAAVGVETFMNKWILFRAGTQLNRETETSLYTGGIGFRGPRFAANYAYITESRDNQVRHAVDLTIPLW